MKNRLIIDYYIKDLFAYGVGNILSGVFSGLPAAGGLTRTLIVETSGAKSQVYSLVSSVFVLVVILGLGSLFKELPEVRFCLSFQLVFLDYRLNFTSFY
jgi:SulP family sulfate permease